MQKIKEDLDSHRIKVEKYNYSLSKETQNFGSQKGFIEIQGDFLKILNIKVTEKLQYVLESDPHKLKGMQHCDNRDKHVVQSRVQDQHKSLYSDSDDIAQSDGEDDYRDLCSPNIQYQIKQSSCSC